jgi:hypothetical protein
MGQPALPLGAAYSRMLPIQIGCYVYRCWNTFDQCVYVGQTRHVMRRIGAHAYMPWFRDVAYVDAAAFATMTEADAEEIAQIRLLRPVNNSNHNRTWERKSTRPRPTKCPAGHPYDAANTLYSSTGSKVCRECKNARARAKKPLKGYAAGENSPSAKLTAAAVADIRRQRALGLSVSSVARTYGVARSTIRNVTEGRTWRHTLASTAGEAAA